MIILGIEYKLEEKDFKYFEKNGGPLLVKKLEKINRKLKEEERMKIYSTQDLDSISTFVHESDKIKCNSTVKFYRGTLPDVGTLPPEPGTSTKDVAEPGTSTKDVVLQTIEGVPENRIEDFVDELIFLFEADQNLVRVLGCCLVTHEPVIVYELRDNDIIPLSDCISSSDHAANFSWDKRIEAAKGVARGLEHFYKFKFKPTYVRGDISSANIMMDTTSYEPKIFHAAGSNLIPTAPAANEKSNVYSFGKVLVELLTGGRPGGTDLSNSIRMAQAKGLFEILDDEMKDKGMEVRKIATVADKCLKDTPEQRPSMKEVLAELLDPPTDWTSGSSRRSRSEPVR